MIKLAPEGYPFIIGSGVLAAVAAYALGPFPALIPALLMLFMIYFFRDPERDIPAGGTIFVSPADGKVIVIRDVHESEHLHADVKQVSVFMSPFNVHVNRAPCDGTVRLVKHNRGGFAAAYREEASIRNENIEMVLGTVFGDLLVRQVAGFLARRAVCRKKKGDSLRKGERYGIIKFSSRLDIYLPKDASIVVRLHEKVKAGETVIAEIPGHS